MQLHHTAVLAAALSLAACEPEPAPEVEKAPRRPSQAACEQVRSALAEQGRRNGLLFEESGTGMIDQQAWLRMSDTSRELIVQSLAMLAQCGSEAPQREVEVTIRNEVGAVIDTRYVGF